jgi:prophage regulatory protein
MHTAFSSPSSAPAAPVMPVSDRTQERFIRLPEVMHLCGLSRSTIYPHQPQAFRNKSLSVEKCRLARQRLDGGNRRRNGWRMTCIAERNRGYDA